MAKAKAKREPGKQGANNGISVAALDRLAGAPALLAIDDLYAGYGQMEVLRGLSLRVARGRSLCLVGPNGAGKSTVLNAIYGFARIFSGTISLSGRDVAKLQPSEKLKATRLAYVLQRDSVFPDMTVEENLLMGGFLLEHPRQAKAAAETVLDRYPALKARRTERARVLSGGERRLLEISRALIMEPEVILIDEPSIGLEPRAIDMIFETLRDLRDEGGKTLVLVEQNARKGLEFADAGYVLVAGQLVKAGPGKELLTDPEMGRLFLGG
ncbi:MAG TPA: ABC transporter ATP-binding protein [Methyloceanibacter sp.]|jgi:branched-chain amino acid transport system ATP-binding protein|nr:ABC transporter ATP-binding protein [Methyloceanibacter sp.]